MDFHLNSILPNRYNIKRSCFYLFFVLFRVIPWVVWLCRMRCQQPINENGEKQFCFVLPLLTLFVLSTCHAYTAHIRHGFYAVYTYAMCMEWKHWKLWIKWDSFPNAGFSIAFNALYRLKYVSFFFSFRLLPLRAVCLRRAVKWQTNDFQSSYARALSLSHTQTISLSLRYETVDFNRIY